MAAKVAMTAPNKLVAPLPHKGTDMRITETTASQQVWSGAVSDPIGLGPRRGDVDSANRRSTRPTTPGIRTSTRATRTTTTRTTKPARLPSAEYVDANDGLAFEDLVVAYFDCRSNKRNTRTAIAFEQNLERNLWALYEELVDGSYRPGRSICFVVTHPKPREVWAADFRDRIVHHLLYNRIGPRFERAFIADTFACIKGRGTLRAAERLESHIRSVTQNWSRPAHYLKLDLSNFFVSIDKRVLFDLLARKIGEPFWLALTETVLFHDPRTDFEWRGARSNLDRVPAHKRLTNQPTHLGLPIGNLSSQFFANVYLDVLDQHAKHHLHARHYVRYVDDFVFLHESTDWLNAVHRDVGSFLPERLGVRLNPRKTILQPVARGVDFVGHVIKPWRRTTRPRTVSHALHRIEHASESDLHQIANSYFGLVGQSTASHTDRARIARAVLRRGHAVNKQFTQTYRSSHA